MQLKWQAEQDFSLFAVKLLVLPSGIDWHESWFVRSSIMDSNVALTDALGN